MNSQPNGGCVLDLAFPLHRGGESAGFLDRSAGVRGPFGQCEKEERDDELPGAPLLIAWRRRQPNFGVPWEEFFMPP